MGMFLHYQNVADNYTPNNIKRSFPVGKSYTKLDPVKASKPYEEYNAKGELIGYFWHYGEVLNLEFNIDGEITVESDALIFTNHGEFPMLSTEGKLYQRAYNVVDFVSWTCVGYVDGNFIWRQDAEFEYDENSNKSVYVDASQYMQDKQLKLVIYNFRMEPVHEVVLNGTCKATVSIDQELSMKLRKGIYYCSLNVIAPGVNIPVFGSKDCVLVVK